LGFAKTTKTSVQLQVQPEKIEYLEDIILGHRHEKSLVCRETDTNAICGQEGEITAGFEILHRLR